jgi:DNA-directed RNA polymerase subunit alpha
MVKQIETGNTTRKQGANPEMSQTGLQVPQWVKKETLPEDNYGKFVIDPLERGYGTTIGNPMRRVLLSALDGAAVVALRVEGVQHEFTAIKGVREDVAEIILNIKMANIKLHGDLDTATVTFKAKGTKKVKAKHLFADSEDVEIMNPDLDIMTLGQEANIEIELDVARGRGYVPAEDNKRPGMAIGTIPIDALFSPVRKVNFRVESARVGQRIDFDRLILEVWTNGCVEPEEAMRAAAGILIEHMRVFTLMEEKPEPVSETTAREEDELVAKLLRNVDDLELSVRSANCLKSAGIRTIADLVRKEEAEMLKYHNFGKKSLVEIENLLHGMGLDLASEIEPEILERVEAETSSS